VGRKSEPNDHGAGRIDGIDGGVSGINVFCTLEKVDGSVQNDFLGAGNTRIETHTNRKVEERNIFMS